LFDLHKNPMINEREYMIKMAQSATTMGGLWGVFKNIT
jgi:hypothetical protein